MYFDECKDKNELKAAYRKLALKHHPDRGGDEDIIRPSMRNMMKRWSAWPSRTARQKPANRARFTPMTWMTVSASYLIKSWISTGWKSNSAAPGSGLAAPRANTAQNWKKRAAAGHRKRKCGIGGRKKNAVSTARPASKTWAISAMCTARRKSARTRRNHGAESRPKKTGKAKRISSLLFLELILKTW